MKTARTHIGITMVLLILLSVLGGCGIGQPPATDPDPSAATAASTGYSTTASTTAETIGQTIQTTTAVTTTAGTAVTTKPPYSLDRVIFSVKEAYFDENKQYTAADLPGVDVLRTEMQVYRNEQAKYTMHMVIVYLNVPGEEQVQAAIEALLKLPFVEKADRYGYVYALE